jgi:hypothetical protein
MKIQTQTAMRILADIYGYPKWEKETKDGQSYDKIIELWDNELSEYTPEQIKIACYRLIKYRKVMTFPTISHLMSELVDEEKNYDDKNEQQRALAELLNRQPPFDDLAIQRTMWSLYGMKYKDYDPELDKTN